MLVKLRGRRDSIPEGDEDLPTVSVIISAYNEEEVLQDKMKNITQIDYPGDKIEFLIGSDGSTDRTHAILQQFVAPRVRAVTFAQRRGKPAVLNELVQRASGEIIIFSDANTMYAQNTVRRLVKHFKNPIIGGVCGRLVLHSDAQSIGGTGESTYWNYENLLKKLESSYKTIVGATGGIYAIRKKLYKPLPMTKNVADDFLVAVHVVLQGFLMVYEETACAHERITNSVSGEFKRRIRISVGNFNGISEFTDLLLPKYGFASFALWSHKIIRWCIPVFLIAIFGLSCFLAVHSPLYRALLFCQGIFSGFGLLGFVAEKMKIQIGILGYPYYFLAMNLAMLIGFVKFLSGRHQPTWDVIR